jgi:ArsR family transcriptional regulator, arsenate/arsenite/antimonite-responsive transcriptional repressor / arsenate reductase (thioredoxin)
MIAPLSQPPQFLGLLSHPLRWQLITMLVQTDLRVQELVGMLNQPQNLVSYHMKQLRKQQIIREHRSTADKREVYYSLDLDRVRALYYESGEALHPGLVDPKLPDQAEAGAQVRVLFLCTHNSARSQMAEAIMSTCSQGIIEVFSAGSEPTSVHPLAIQAMAEMNIDLGDHRSKGIEQFTGQNFDYIITVCDRARESCPVFPNDPNQIHWSLCDPAEVQGSERERSNAFRETALHLNTRIGYLLLMFNRNRSIP